MLVFNVIQNPDGRIAGTRANGNGFDLNRDYITQSQSETVASVDVIREWFPTGAYDLHGYVEPTLVEGTTVPHNPGIEYDLWTKWNQPRMDANEAGLEPARASASPGRSTTSRPSGSPRARRCPRAGMTGAPSTRASTGSCAASTRSTVETCNEIDATCGIDGVRAAARSAASVRCGRRSSWSTRRVDFLVENRREMLYDQYEIYRRGAEDAPRPELTGPLPFPGTTEDHDYMTPYPRAHVIPVGNGQRSDAEAKRLVDFLLANDIEVRQLRRDYRFGNRTFQAGSYVAFMDQSLRALGNTMLDVGDDISDRVTQLYAPPGAWSNGFLWGADVVTIGRDRRFTPNTRPVDETDAVEGGVRSGRSDWLALEVDSRTAVATANKLIGDGVAARLALEQFETRDGDMPAGSILFAESARAQIRAAAREAGIWFEPVSGLLPRREAIERVPRIACLCSALENWALETRLGFSADQFTNNSINTAATDPLANYDVIYNTGQNYPADTPENANVRARYAAFFARGGGYVGARINGANFVAPETGGSQLAGLQAEWQGRQSQAGKATEQVDQLLETFGRVSAVFQEDVSGIIYWDNDGGESSPITGAYPDRDTALVEDPVWFTDVPDDVAVDGRLPASDYLASGHWPNPDPSAGGSPVILHGPNTAGTARITLFGIDPLFRAHPERSFPAVSEGFYWGDI